MLKSRSSWRFVVLTAAVTCVGFAVSTHVHAADPEEAAAPKIKPRFEDSTFTIDGHALKARGVRHRWAPTFSAGERLISVHEDSVEQISAARGDKPDWSIKSEDGHPLQWITSEGDVAFFVGFTPENKKHRAAPDSPTRLRRLDLSTHKWLPPLPLPQKKEKPDQHDEIVAIEARPGMLAVLTQQSEGGDGPVDEPESAGYRVTVFRGDLKTADKPEWSANFASSGKRPSPGVALWASRMPDYASSDLRNLTWIGNDLLVCGGEKEDVMRLDGATGKVQWRISRVWEYARGFIGPSVWQHYIARFAVERFGSELEDPKTPEEKKAAREEAKSLEKKRTAFDKQFQCAIVGGPVVVSMGKPRRGQPQEYHLFVAIAKGPDDWNWGYLSDCVVYEINDSGEVLAMANLPRMVQGRKHSIVDNDVLWACEKGAFVRLRAQDVDQGIGMGPGGSDHLCEIAWYRQLRTDRPKAWLSADPAGSALAFGKAFALTTSSGGFVRAQGDHVYAFPLAVVNLDTGAQRSAMLTVPFDGDITLPNTNFSRGGDETHALGPYLLGVTGLEIRGQTLDVLMGEDGDATSLTFDLSALAEQHGKEPPR